METKSNINNSNITEYNTCTHRSHNTDMSDVKEKSVGNKDVSVDAGSDYKDILEKKDEEIKRS